MTDVDDRVAGSPPRSDEQASAGTSQRSRAVARAGRTPCRGAGLWRMPHRSARCRGRPAGSPVRTSSQDTKWSPKSWRSAQTQATNSVSVTGSASRGCATPVESASSAPAAGRTSVRSRATPAGTLTAGMPNSPRSQPLSPTHSRRGIPTTNWPRYCAPASSAIAPCCVPTFRPAGGSASTASAVAHTSPLRWHWHGAPRCM